MADYFQVKELGAVVENCSCVAEDMAKIFDVYWYLGVPHTPLPPTWPPEYDTSFNNNTPMKVLLNATKSSVYISVGSLLCMNCLKPWFHVKIKLF